MIKTIIRYARTVAQRIGFVLVCVALGIWLVTAVHWNIVEKPFFYQEESFSFKELPQPANVTGMTWHNTTSSWVLVDEQCVTAYKSNWENAALLKRALALWPTSCEKQIVLHQTVFHREQRQSISDYVSNLFNPWGNYFWINAAAFFCFLIGFFLYSGALEKLLRWIKVGSE